MYKVYKEAGCTHVVADVRWIKNSCHLTNFSLQHPGWQGSKTCPLKKEKEIDIFWRQDSPQMMLTRMQY